MKIHIDRSKCNGLAVCESIAPDFFVVNDEGELVVLRDCGGDSDRADLESAVESCPTEAISLED